jgi:hypothetical protein
MKENVMMDHDEELDRMLVWAVIAAIAFETAIFGVGFWIGKSWR